MEIEGNLLMFTLVVELLKIAARERMGGKAEITKMKRVLNSAKFKQKFQLTLRKIINMRLTWQKLNRPVNYERMKLDI
jgi:hypothetical protein